MLLNSLKDYTAVELVVLQSVLNLIILADEWLYLQFIVKSFPVYNSFSNYYLVAWLAVSKTLIKTEPAYLLFLELIITWSKLLLK
jgi:hypothetical protein